MILYVLAEYRNAREGYTPGQVIEVSQAKADWLLRDSPGSFSTTAPIVEKPPKDKSVKSRAVRKKRATKATVKK